MNYAAPLPSVVTLHPDPIIRAGVVASLRRHTSLDIVDEEHDADPSPGHSTSVVIAELAQAMRMAEAVSRSALGSTERNGSTTRTLVLTANDREADIRRAIEAGVDGYILIGGPLSDLIDGVEALACGRRYLARPVAQRMADSMTRTSLTTRERDVLQLVAAGESNKVIGRKLGIELGTVKSHVTAIMTKLNATSRTQAAAIARAQGLT